ncbi:Putative inositolphosphorylceramide synthase subunit Kei1 [Septoria linicola]|uniref:Inositolphosphorylceramide synthase subunit Kei1 n=1 Tax=Septoria linicola TaxID=215465 RepID=A0A9Q9END2_9PEZI|nr:putative inositolphosphorylceramide synthase subunit Kei1 [Septoria linicola]USW56940.1 Putative inositolphosphorylceramide synthase subunit Kei1 [Septoria linicola]
MAPSILRFPKPRSLLHFVSLRTATEFINLTLVINKVTGLYGILALFTGYELNWLQLSHYIYSLILFGLILYLMPSIRRPDQPLRNVALAYIYVMDTVVNGVYTTLFGMGWFLLLSQHLEEPGKDNPLNGSNGLGGSGTMGDTAGFTNPEHNVTEVNVIAKPASGVLSGQDAVAYATGSGPAAIGGAVLQSDSMTSIALLALFTVVRVYFCLVVMSYARSILRQYVAQTSSSSMQYSTSETAYPTMAPSPFSADRLEGAGWQGKLGRTMLKFPSRRYWLGREETDSQMEWERATSGRFESGRNGGKSLRIKVPENGVGERERRARSGTGPPLPVKVTKGPE